MIKRFLMPLAALALALFAMPFSAMAQSKQASRGSGGRGPAKCSFLKGKAGETASLACIAGGPVVRRRNGSW